MSNQATHRPHAPRPAPASVPCEASAPHAGAAPSAHVPASGPGIVGGQGRTAQEVTWSAEAGLVAVMAAGFVLLVVALGYVAGVAL